MKKTLITLAVLAFLACASGCTVLDGYTAVAASTARGAEDHNIAAWSFNACATPLSAVARHPDLVPALRALCLPAGAGANPAALLDAVPTAVAK
jgi:hypothetical protein